MRFWIALILSLGILLAIRPAATRDQASVPRPHLTIDVRPSGVLVHGVVGSLGHEAILAQALAQGFPGKTAVMDVAIASGLPAGWALATDLAVRAMATMRTGIAEISDNRLTLQGLTDARAPLDASLDRLRAGLDPSMSLQVRVDEIGPAAPLARQCIELFRSAVRNRRVEFAADEATISTADYPLLDELVSLAADCPAATIAVTGHTDDSGDEMANLRLSQARADAVAGYLVARGIPSARIEASGRGSSVPLVSEGSTRASGLNRRIDFDFRLP